MNLASLILLAIKISISLTVFGLGLGATLQDATHLFQRPGLLLRSLVSMNIVMPLFAGVLVAAFDLHPAIELALIALSISPVPPFLPKKELKAGASTEYSFGLQVTAAILAIVLIPITIEILGKVFSRPVHISPGAVAMVVLTTVLAPLAAGILVRLVAPGLAAKIAKPIGLVATILLLVCVLPILFTAMPAIVSLIGNGTLLAITVFTGFGLAVGHLLGGPIPNNRTVLALCTATRHPGVAIAIAHATFPQQKLAVPAVLLYLIVSAVVSIPYLKWRRKHEVPDSDLPFSGPEQKAHRSGA
jgi:BASS family bile acid:Na+ symporter